MKSGERKGLWWGAVQRDLGVFSVGAKVMGRLGVPASSLDMCCGHLGCMTFGYPLCPSILMAQLPHLPLVEAWASRCCL